MTMKSGLFNELLIIAKLRYTVTLMMKIGFSGSIFSWRLVNRGRHIWPFFEGANLGPILYGGRSGCQTFWLLHFLGPKWPFSFLLALPLSINTITLRNIHAGKQYCMLSYRLPHPPRAVHYMSECISVLNKVIWNCICFCNRRYVT